MTAGGFRDADLVATACTVCRAGEAEALWDVNGLPVVRCRRCGHRYVDPQPTPAALTALYGEGYFENPSFSTGEGGYFGYGDYFTERANIDRLKSRVLARAERLVPVGRLLDVGCGPGFLVDLAERRGWDAWGVDVNESAVQWANEHGLTQVRSGGPTAVADAAPFDCVVLFDVIEHFPDPRAELAALWDLIRPGGVLVTVTPDIGSLMGRAMGKHWMEVKRVPEHLHFFDGAGLAKVLDLGGFTVVERHTIGNIASVHTLLGHLKFYAPRAMGAVDKVVAELGYDGATVEVDPGSKTCVYAVRDHSPAPLDQYSPGPPPVARKIRRREFRAEDASLPESEHASLDAGADFRAAQRRYWESRERFLDPRDPGPAAFALPKLAWAEQYLDLKPDTEILDVGAGNGTVTWYLAQRSDRVVGLDFSHNLLVRSPCAERMVQADAAALPFPDDSFDIVVEGNFLHHVADPVAILREMARVSRRHLLLIEPNRWHPPMAAFMAVSKPDWRGLRFDESHVVELVESAGLRVVAAAPQGAVYPNATPRRLLGPLGRFDKPSRVGAYVVAVVEVP